MTTPHEPVQPQPFSFPNSPPPHSRRRRALKWTSISLAVLLVMVAGGAVAGYFYFTGRITKQPIVIPSGSAPRPVKIATKAENFVLIGSDSRAGANGKGTGGSGPNAVEGARSDTTIILHIAAGNRGATLISIPRDSYVTIPSCVTGPNGEHSEPFTSKFNAAFSTGGVKYGASCTVHTIETLTGIHVDHYAVVDFVGFKSMVDALGGVRMCVAKPLQDPVHYLASEGLNVGSGLNLPAGPNVEIDGQQALDLMRARYNLDGGGDLPRIKRQQQFVAAMIRKATSSGLLVHPFELVRFLHAATGSLTTDGFGIGTMKKLAGSLHDEGAGKVRLLTVPLDSVNPPDVPSADVYWDPSAAPALWNAIIHDEPIPGTPKASPSPSPSASASPSPSSTLSVPPSNITINVLNGNGQPGAAAKAAAALSGEGFHATVGGDAPSSSYTSTVVEYGPSRVQSSQTVAAAITGSTRKADSTLGNEITVIVGSDYSGVVPVTIGSASSSPTPTPSATPSIPSFSASQHNCLS